MRHVVAVTVVGLSLAAMASAATVYGSDNASHLYTIDPTTGATTLVGTLPVTMFDIAINGFSMYGTDNLQHLYSINAGTAAGTDLGGTGAAVNALVFGSNGTLYGAGGDGLYTINTTSAAATLVGTGSYSSAGDLEFVGGILYLTSYLNSSTDQLFQINPATGSGTLIGSIGFANVWGLAYVDGVMYGFTNPGSGSPQVISINLSTGAGTALHNYSPGFDGVAAVPEVVPEPGSLAALGIGLATLGGLGWRRRRR